MIGYLCGFPIHIPEESMTRLHEARSEWVKRHVDQEMERWKRLNRAPGFNDHPMAIDRYEDLYRSETIKEKQRWSEKFDSEVLREGLENFLKTLE